MSDVCLQSAFANWDSATHGTVGYSHGPTGICIVPVHVSVPLLDRGGYRMATATDIGAELAVLEARIARLKSF